MVKNAFQIFIFLHNPKKNPRKGSFKKNIATREAPNGENTGYLGQATRRVPIFSKARLTPSWLVDVQQLIGGGVVVPLLPHQLEEVPLDWVHLRRGAKWPK